MPNIIHRTANCPTLPFMLLATAILMFLHVHAYMLKISQNNAVMRCGID